MARKVCSWLLPAFLALLIPASAPAQPNDPGKGRVIRGGGFQSASYSNELAHCAGRSLTEMTWRENDMGFPVAATRRLRLP